MPYHARPSLQDATFLRYIYALTVQATMGGDLSNQNIVNNSPAMEDDMPSLTTPPPSDSDSNVSMMDLSEVD